MSKMEITNREALAVVISRFLGLDPWVMISLRAHEDQDVRMELRAGNGPSSPVELLSLFEAAVAMIRLTMNEEGLDPDQELSELDERIATTVAEKED